MEDNPRIERWLGVAHRVGSDMRYWVINENGNVLARTTVQYVSILDQKIGQVKEKVQEFDETLSAWLHDTNFIVENVGAGSKWRLLTTMIKRCLMWMLLCKMTILRMLMINMLEPNCFCHTVTRWFIVELLNLQNVTMTIQLENGIKTKYWIQGSVRLRSWGYETHGRIFWSESYWETESRGLHGTWQSHKKGLPAVIWQNHRSLQHIRVSLFQGKVYELHHFWLPRFNDPKIYDADVNNAYINAACREDMDGSKA